MNTHDGQQKENIRFDPPRSLKATPARSLDNLARTPLRSASLVNIRDIVPPTNEPDESRPLSFASYFMSPLSVILRSLEGDSIPFNDLANAYRLLASRVVAQGKDLEDESCTSQPAVKAMISAMPQLLQAMRRDIGYALQAPVSVYCTLLGLDEEKVKSRPPQHDEIACIQALTALCHEALYLLTELLGSPAPILLSGTSDSDISLIIDQLLTILLRPKLPSYQPLHTRRLILGILQAQELRPAVISQHKTRISLALRISLDGELDDVRLRIAALKAFRALVTWQPTILTPSLSDLLPVILSLLFSTTEDICTWSAHALSGLALAKLTTPALPLTTSTSMTSIIKIFIHNHSPRKNASPLVPHLSDVLKSSLDEPPAHATSASATNYSRPAWAITVLSSLIILSDHPLFSDKVSVKLFLDFLGNLWTHKDPPVRKLHPLVWRCLVWAYTRLPFRGSRERDTKRKAFQAVAQETRGGIGIAVIAAALRSGMEGPDKEVMSDVLELVQKMSGEGDKFNVHLRNDAVNVFLRLLGVKQLPGDSTWSSADMVAKELLDGTLLRCEPDDVGEVVASITVPGLSLVRALTEEEIVRHWDELLSVWQAFAEISMAVDAPRSHPTIVDIVHSWQTLLLAQSQLTQQNGHLEAPAEISKRTVNIMAELLSSKGCSDRQVRCLSLVKKLWATIKNCFPSGYRSLPFDDLAQALMSAKSDFDFANEVVAKRWLWLAREIIFAATNANVLRIFKTFAENASGPAAVELGKELWVALCQSEGDWGSDHLTELACIPSRDWKLSEEHLSLWSSIAKRLKSSDVLECMMPHLSPDNIEVLLVMPNEALNVFQRVTSDPHNLQLFDKFGTEIYTEETASDMPILLRFFDTLQRLLSDLDDGGLVEALVILTECYRVWLEDESRFLTVDDYNSYVIPIYQDALRHLSRLEPSSEALISLTPFLTAVFEYHPLPGHGTRTFMKYWEATYSEHPEFIMDWPESIKDGLFCLDMAYGTHFADDIPRDPESQQTPSTVVADSQPPFELPDWNAEFSVVAHFDSIQEFSSVEQGRAVSPIEESQLPDDGGEDYDQQGVFEAGNQDPVSLIQSIHEEISSQRKRSSPTEDTGNSAKRQRTLSTESNLQVPLLYHTDPMSPEDRPRTRARRAERESQLLTPEPSQPNSSVAYDDDGQSSWSQEDDPASWELGMDDGHRDVLSVLVRGRPLSDDGGGPFVEDAGPSAAPLRSPFQSPGHTNRASALDSFGGGSGSFGATRSAPLRALHNAYNLFSEVSQITPDDLVQARELMGRLGRMLNGHGHAES